MEFFDSETVERLVDEIADMQNENINPICVMVGGWYVGHINELMMSPQYALSAKDIKTQSTFMGVPIAIDITRPESKEIRVLAECSVAMIRKEVRKNENTR